MKNGSKWLLAMCFCLASGIASAQCGTVECSPIDEDMTGQGPGTITCPNPEDAAPGCRSDAAALTPEKKRDDA